MPGTYAKNRLRPGGRGIEIEGNMWDAIERELIYLWFYSDVQARQILPYYFLGMFIGSIISVFGKNSINNLICRTGVKNWGLVGIVLAILLGFISPLCMYGTIPIAASLSRQGLKDDFLAAFMVGSILINPQLVIYSLVLGPQAFYGRLIVAFVISLAAALIVRYRFQDREFFNFESINGPRNRDTDPNLLLRFLKNLYRNFKATFIYVVIGIILASLFTRVVPADIFAGIFGRNNGIGVAAAATIGVPLYVCGGGTIPLLQEWLLSGMTLGAAIAFMMTGQALKITNLSAVKIILGAKVFLGYIIFIMASSLVTGLITDLLVEA